MKIVIAPNALKESLSAFDAAQAIESGILDILPTADTVCIPIADGGDGLLHVLKQSLDGDWRSVDVTGPLGQMRKASFLHCPSTSLAVVELASAAGLALLKPAEYDVCHASTYGVGQLIKSALDLDINHLILGIGGSATNDAAMGIATALGVRFLNEDGKVLTPCAANLSYIDQIDMINLDQRLSDIQFDVVCDVRNPLLGEQGAAAIFSPQKGASPDDVIFLENALSHFAHIIHRDFHKNIRDIEGGGAAGGVGAGLCALFNASLCRGADLVLRLLDLPSEIKNADILITAEGRLDAQTEFGKAPYVVAELAKKYHVPVYMIAGQVDENWQDDLLIFDKLCTLTADDISKKYAMRHAKTLMKQAAKTLFC